MHTELYIALVVLQVLDAYTTYRAIKGGAYESNKLLLRLDALMRRFTNAKWAWLLAAKVVGVVASWVLYKIGATELMAGLFLLYLAIVVNNYKIMRAQ